MPRPAFRRWTLRWLPRLSTLTARTLLWTATLVAALWLAASAALLWTQHQQAARQADTAGANIAAGVEQSLVDSLTQVDAALRRLADGLQRPGVQGLAPPQRNEVLFAAAAALPGLAFIDALDANGDVVASLSPQEHATNWASRDYFLAHRRDPALGLYVSRPFAATNPDLAGVAISIGRTGVDGSFAGVVVCGIRLSYVRAMFDRLTLGAHGTIALVRTHGVVLMRRPFDTNTIGYSLDPAAPLARAIEAGAGQVTLDDPLGRVRQRFTLRRVGTLPLVVAVGLAPEDFQANVWPEALTMLAAGILLAVLAVAAAVRLRQEAARGAAIEQESAEQGRFLATISHELRAPLHGILGYAEQLRNAEDPAAPRDRRVDAILNAGRLLREVIDRLLDYWRLEARGPTLQMAQLDMPALLEECRAVVEPEARAKSLELRCVAASDAPWHFVTDGTWLRQVVVNLLANAVKFTRRGAVELRYGGQPDRIWIEVADTGPGIPPHLRHRLFREYDRLGAEESDIAGSGLGLSIVERLARRMGGQIDHRDNPGGGSIFRVDLPSGVAPEPAAPIGAAGAAPHRPLRILVTDDSDVHRDVARTVLTHAGHDVVEAADGSDAVQRAAHQDFDVIMMDMCMQAMDGLAAAGKIRALPGPRGAVPIIAVTANALDADVERYRRAGLAGHLAKPFTREALLRTIAAAAQRRPRDPAAADLPPAPDADAPLLNTAALTELEALLGGERMAQHLGTLADTTTALLTALDDCDSPADSRRQEELAHIVAGDAGQLGFAALSAAARRFMAAVTDEGSDVVAAAAGLRATAEEARNVLRQRSESRCHAFNNSVKVSEARRDATESTLR